MDLIRFAIPSESTGRCRDFYKRTICGVEAEGFDFSYNVQGVAQKAQNIVFKHGKTCYTLYWVERAGGGSAGERALESILDTLALA